MKMKKIKLGKKYNRFHRALSIQDKKKKYGINIIKTIKTKCFTINNSTLYYSKKDIMQQ